MSKVMLILHTQDLAGAEVFIDRKYIGIYPSKHTNILHKICESLLEDSVTIVEEINIDTYLTEKERNMFLFNVPESLYITEEEQDAILEGQIDYAFDMIKKRIK